MPHNMEAPADSGRGLMLPPVTAKDVAREAGVHTSTVSRSLDPQQQARISPETRERVIAVARRLGYRPHFTASSLRRQRTMTVGVTVPSFRNPVYGALIQSIGEELQALGYSALFLADPDGADQTEPTFNTLLDRRVDGIICTSAREGDQALLERVAATGTPVVMAMRWLEGLPQIPAARTDDRLGGAMAAQHLIDLGHRRLIEVPGPTQIMNFPARSAGFAERVAAVNGVEQVLHDLSGAAPTVESGYDTTRALLARGLFEGVTGVFAPNDLIAMGAIEALSESGRVCPTDVSVVGFNDSMLSDRLSPALTTLRAPVAEEGALAVRALASLMGVTDEAVDMTPPAPMLIPRASTRAPRVLPR